MKRLVFFFLLFAPALAAQPRLMGVPEVQALAVDSASARISYGPDAQQFGDLRLPAGRGPHAVVVIIHGGCWLSAYDLTLMDPMATALTRAGYATWNLEYRRVGNDGGGWPNTFRDVAAGVNYLRELAPRYKLDLRRVVVTGHSAGGHLALWLGGRRRLPAGSPIADAGGLPLSGVVSLAGIVDLERYLVRDRPACGANVDELMGALPEAAPERYRQASPIHMLPMGTPQRLITGSRDGIVPVAHVAPYADAARAAGDVIESVVVPDAGHFEVIAPGSNAWPAVEQAIGELIRRRPPQGPEKGTRKSIDRSTSNKEK